MRQLWILVGVLLAICNYVKSQETGRNIYNIRYEHLNVDSILSSNRLVINYVDCLLSKKPCPPEGKDLKRILPEALRTKCIRCSHRQKENALKIIRRLYEDFPAQYKELRAKWDPTGEYHRRFEEYLRGEEFNAINSNDGRPARPQQNAVSNAGGDTNSVGQSQVNIQRIRPNTVPQSPVQQNNVQQDAVPLSAIPQVTRQTTQRVFTPRPTVATAPPQRPAVVVQQNRPVQNQNQIPVVNRVATQEQQPQQPNNGNAQNNAPAQNLLPNQVQTQRPDRSPENAQNNNQNTFASQPEPTLNLSSRFSDDIDDEDQQPPAPAVSSSGGGTAIGAPTTTINANTNQNVQNSNTNTNNNDGLVNVNDIRTRKGNTSAKQTELFIQILENDETLRTGILKPNMNPNYINEKWDEVERILNSCGAGPQLCATEWKKRFCDWKNAIRSKARKIIEHRKGTGGGEPTKLVLSPVEEKALALWGRVCVDGSATLLISAGLTHLPTVIKTSATVVGIPPNIIDNFFVPPSTNTYQPPVRPIQGLFKSIGSKVVNTAAFVGGMLRATVQVFVGNRQQQQFQ